MIHTIRPMTAIAKLDKTDALLRYNDAVGQKIQGAREVTPDDLGREFTKAGRTTDITLGKLTVLDMDGLPVGYDSGVLRFNDQLEFSGGPGRVFSQGGDSGSLILDRTGWAVGLLFAGGESNGEDFTYANRILRVLEALGVQLA